MYNPLVFQFNERVIPFSGITTLNNDLFHLIHISIDLDCGENWYFIYIEGLKL